MYEGRIIKSNDKFIALIVSPNNNNSFDIIKRADNLSEYEAMIWVDDEISRLTTGQGIWEHGRDSEVY